MRAVSSGILVVSLAINVALVYRIWGGPSAPEPGPSATVVMQTPGGLLEVSTITSHERFESTKDHKILGVPFGRTVSMIEVPAVYRYHIQLAKEWSLRVEGGALVVVAPPVQPSLPVAVDLGKLRTFSAGVWTAFTGPDELAALQKTVTPALAKKASSADMLQLQRESARKTVTEFVHKWVVEQPKWGAGKVPVVLVFFQDEPLGARIAPLLRDVVQ